MTAIAKPTFETPAPEKSGELGTYLKNAQRMALDGGVYRLRAEEFIDAWREHFGLAELHEIVLPERTLSRRLVKGESLTPSETDRALRVARVWMQAERVFGSREKADRWLRKVSDALEGQTPLAMLRTEIGAKAVEDELTRIDYGIFA